MKTVSLLTDFGIQDGYAGILKGVIWSIAPDAQIVDLTHEVSPQNIQEGAFVLRMAASYFPAGTVHIAVIDPGVGTTRRAMAARIGGQFFIAPDNGLLTLVILHAERAGLDVEYYHLNQPGFWLPRVSNIFHGRDIFAPVGAYLANGIPLDKMGVRIYDPGRFQIPNPISIAGGLRGQILFIDHFGNILTNLPGKNLPRNFQQDEMVVKIRGTAINNIENLSCKLISGDLSTITGMPQEMWITAENGKASEFLQTRVGDAVDILFA